MSINNFEIGFNFDNSYLSLPPILMSKVNPTLTPSPKLVLLNNELCENLNLDCKNYSKKELSLLFSGKYLDGFDLLEEKLLKKYFTILSSIE